MPTKMKLEDFYRYVRENRTRISDTYREIEEIQVQFNNLYTSLQDERNKLMADTVPLLVDRTEDQLPPELRRLLEEQVAVERQKVLDEIARLKTDVAAKRAKSDELIREAQRQVEYLREQNPILDKQEEGFKARAASMEKELSRIDGELKELSWFPIGWLTNWGNRRRLRKDRYQLEKNIETVKGGIRTVREKWKAEKERLQKAQGDLQGQWQGVSVEASQLQARLDFLSANVENESLRNAAWNLLGGLTEVPVEEASWAEKLRPLVAKTDSKGEYERGLRSVAEILGVLKGLTEGMDRFIKSVATVYEEQRRYKLPGLTVALPDSATSFHSIWPDLQAKVKDEKYLGTHPLEFEKRITAILPERLSKKAIQKMFEDMGSALSRATKAWH